jgi:hypothetical protein
MQRIYFLFLLFFLPGFLWSQDAATIQKIREEGLNNTR